MPARRHDGTTARVLVVLLIIDCRKKYRVPDTPHLCTGAKPIFILRLLSQHATLVLIVSWSPGIVSGLLLLLPYSFQRNTFSQLVILQLDALVSRDTTTRRWTTEYEGLGNSLFGRSCFDSKNQHHHTTVRWCGTARGRNKE